MSDREPPTWDEVFELVEASAVLYAVLFALAVVASYVHRTKKLRVWQVETDAPVSWLLSFSNWLAVRAVDLTLLRMVASTCVCILYVYVTYEGHIPFAVRVFYVLVGATVLARFAFRIVQSSQPVAALFSVDNTMEGLQPSSSSGSLMRPLEPVLEIVSVASLLLARRNTWLNFSFLQAYMVLARYFRVERFLEQMFIQKTSPFRRQLVRLSLEFLVFIYVFACGLQLFELLGDPTAYLSSTTFELVLHNSLYFTVVTVFTVGYGDFVPYTLFGRIWIILIIVSGVYIVSLKVGQVIDVVSGLRRGMGSFVKEEHVRHCVVCGNVRWEYFKTFVQEFYSDDDFDQTKIVVMCDRPNWTEDVWNSFFQLEPRYRHNVVYLEGSCMTREDLLRAQVETADAVFVLNNQHDPDPYLEDSETLKRILTVRSFCPDLPIYSMCALRDSMLQIGVALEHRAGMMTPDAFETLRHPSQPSQFRENFAGFGPGGSSFLSQLNPALDGQREGDGSHAASSSALPRIPSIQAPSRQAYHPIFSDADDDDDGMVIHDYDGKSDRKSEALCMQEVEMSLLAENIFCNGLSTLLSNLILNVVPMTKVDDPPWMVEYKIGAECRLSYVRLPLDLHNMRFSDIALPLYDQGILLLATKRYSDTKWKNITPDTRIHLSTIGLVATFHSTKFVEKVMTSVVRNLASATGGSSSSDGADSPRSVPSVTDEGFRSRDETAFDDHGHRFRSQGARLAQANRAQRSEQPGLAVAEDTSAIHLSESDGTLPNVSPRHGLDPALATARNGQGRMSTPEGGVPRHSDYSSDDPEVLGARRRRETRPTAATRPIDDLDGVADVVLNSAEETFMERAEPGQESASARPKSVSTLTGGGEEAPEAVSSHTASTTHVPPLDTSRLNESGDAAKTDSREYESNPPNSLRRGARVSFPNTPTQGMPPRRRSSSAGARGTSTRTSTLRPDPDRGSSRKSQALPLLIFGDAPIPARLKGHIVVCVIGQMGLVNLKHFLHRVWIKRHNFKRETPVVAICPKITDSIEDDVSQFASQHNRLFVIQGNSLSIATLKRAQFKEARAIVVLACECKNDVDRMDAKAIFTVMTLDHLLEKSSNTFVCTMLDAEESMQLLRAPAHPRRRGADLGRAPEQLLIDGRTIASPNASMDARKAIAREGSSPALSAHQPMAGASTAARSSASASDLQSTSELGARTDPSQVLPTTAGGASTRPQNSMSLDLRPSTSYGTMEMQAARPELSGFFGTRIAPLLGLSLPSTSPSPAGTYLGALGGQDTRGVSTMRIARTPSLSALRRSAQESSGIGPSTPIGMNSFFDSSTSLSFDDPTGRGSSTVFPRRRSVGGVGIPRTISAATAIGVGSEDPLVDGYVVHRKSRDELFERQRYASGEMMISSVYAALLIREFAMPGIMSVVRKIFGAGIGRKVKSKKCWIRTVKIPLSWIQAGKGGQRIYRELFAELLELGVVSLGLYRSGEARVRVLSRVQVDPEAHGIPVPGDNGIAQAPLQFSGDGYTTEPAGEHNPTGTRPHSGIPESESRPTLYTYTCPTSGKIATFEEVVSGKNVLPYVYTNPEPYTLVSERDAVYVLAHPSAKIPDEW